jgi:uncharacterized protein (TIGR03067 family)
MLVPSDAEETDMGVRPLALAAIVLLAGVSLAPAGQREDEEVLKEVERLQGVWTLVELEVNGAKVEDQKARSWVLVVEGHQYNPGSGDLSIEYTFRLDPTRVPKAIDLIPAEGPNQGRVFRGVYGLDGDTFTVCRPLEPDDDRPAGLSPRRGPGLTRSVWKRKS